MADTVTMQASGTPGTGSGHLKLRIITPERVVVDQEVHEVSAVAANGQHCLGGELTILPGHEPLITALAVDVVSYRLDKEQHIAAVIKGVLEVGENQVTILSDTVELDTEIDEAKAKEDKERALAEKSQKTEELDVHLQELALSRAIARIKAVELGRKRRGQRLHE